MTLAYEFFDSEPDAFAQVLTVCIRVKDGSILPYVFLSHDHGEMMIARLTKQ